MMASASLPGRLSEDTASSVSGASFLLILPYSSRASWVERMSALASLVASSSSCRRPTLTTGNSSSWGSTSRSGFHMPRYRPSNSTLMVPSGSLKSCNILLTVPMVNRSSAPGLSTSGSRWATRKMRLSWLAMEFSMALMDASRPTNRGTMERGNMTTSRSDMSGRRVWSESLSTITKSLILSPCGYGGWPPAAAGAGLRV